MATQRVCKIEACNKRHFGLGLCNAHYFRWRKYGDPLAGGRGLASPGEPLAWLREQIKDAREGCLFWPYARHRNGYGAVKIDGRQVLAHRLVCEEIHGPPPSPQHQAAHSCGNGRQGCIAPSHLRWATPKENMADSVAMGRVGLGEPGKARKLTEEDVRLIRKLSGQYSQRKIATDFGIAQSTVRHILIGKIWGWLTDEQIPVTNNN